MIYCITEMFFVFQQILRPCLFLKICLRVMSTGQIGAGLISFCKLSIGGIRRKLIFGKTFSPLLEPNSLIQVKVNTFYARSNFRYLSYAYGNCAPLLYNAKSKILKHFNAGVLTFC